MTESSDVQALAKISTEVDESQIKTILSSQCIKAQVLLVNKLRKQTKRHKEVCNFMSSANLKLESEINLAEKEIITLRLCQQTLKSANIELKKELLIAKENKLDIIQRTKDGEKKYDQLWLECKSRFESIPYVKKLLQAQDKAKEISKNMEELQKQAELISNEIVVKRNAIDNLDKRRIIELAKYIVEDRPKQIKIIEEMNDKILQLTKEINEMNTEQNSNSYPKTVDEIKIVNEEPVSKELTTDLEYDLLGPLVIPNIQQGVYNLDTIPLNLEQEKKTDTLENLTPQVMPMASTSQKYIEKSLWVQENRKQCFYSFFDKPSNTEKRHENYSKKKIINILEDVKIDKSDAMNLIAKVAPEKLQPIHAMAPISNTDKNQHKEDAVDTKFKIIEVTELYNSQDTNILIPPTQFTDGKDPEVLECYMEEAEVSNNKLSQQIRENVIEKDLQTEANEDCKKKVTFGLTPFNITEINRHEDIVEVEANETINSQLDASAVSEEDYAKIKDMIFKKHNLDLSPQFIYSKNTSTNMTNEKVVTSKFFENNDRLNSNDEDIDNKCTITMKDVEDNGNDENTLTRPVDNNPSNEKADDDVIEISTQRTSELYQYPVKGFLFSHGPHDIPDSLDVSISTTGFEEGDSEFPHCIDSSLLLSPKADLPMSVTCENAEIQSQEVPNFLTGLRKTGLSFFGESSKPKNDNNTNTQNTGDGFSFNFSGEEKKSRGGLFSMFH